MKNFFSILVIFVFLLGCCSEVNAAESKKSKTRVSAKSTKPKLSKKKKSVTQVAKKIPKKSVTVAKATETVSEEAPQSITYVERANKNSKPILHFKSDGSPQLEDLESLSDLEDSSVITDTEGDKIKLTLDIGLQKKAAKILQTYALPWSTVVAINPKSGKILALAGYSAKDPSGQQFLTKASFPAASLFKLITASAAVEQKGLNGDDTIYFRGGNYTISQNNYYPDERLDRRQITFADALGKSINPAFARVALNNLTSSSLERFAHAYLFNQNIPFDVPIEVSQFVRPETDYEIARTAAGFGPVTLSPLHAALITAAIANKGTMMRPYFIEKVTSEDGKLKYSATPYPIKVSVLSSTAKELLQMMEATVESGTARKQFIKLTNPFLLNNSIAAKTGTLSNTNPKGICHWFVVAAPVEDPEIVMSVLIVDPGYVRIKSSFIAKELLEYYFRDRDILGRSAIPITLEFPASSSVGVG